MLLLAVTNNIHGRNEGWFNLPTPLSPIYSVFQKPFVGLQPCQWLHTYIFKMKNTVRLHLLITSHLTEKVLFLFSIDQVVLNFYVKLSNFIKFNLVCTSTVRRKGSDNHIMSINEGVPFYILGISWDQKNVLLFL